MTTSPEHSSSRFDHDQLMKGVLRAFFPDFLRLFDPATAAGLDLSTVTFRDVEVFTDIPQGERRLADVVAEVQTREGVPELVVIHVEIQREREPDFEARMHRYFMALRLRENKPVIPIALVFYPAKEGLARVEYIEELFGQRILTFRFLQISLPVLSATVYAEEEILLGTALAGLMDLPTDRASRLGIYRICLRRIHQAQTAGELDEARAFLLGNLLRTYFTLSVGERQELTLQLQEEGETVMEATELTWAGQVYVQAQRDNVRRIIQRRLGAVSPTTDALIAATDTEDKLNALLDRASVATTEDDLIG